MTIVQQFRSQRSQAEQRIPGPFVCVVEAEARVTRLAAQYLERAEFRVQTVASAQCTPGYLEGIDPIAFIVETVWSDARGLELCRLIRHFSRFVTVPVILISEQSSEEDRVGGLESGADDYITHLASGREFVARVRAVLQRFARHGTEPGWPCRFRPPNHFVPGVLSSAIRVGRLTIDTAAMRIWIGEREIETTYLEFRLIYFLAQNQRRVFTRDQLLDAVWGIQYLEARSVDACIRRLRNKIEPDPTRPSYLRTIRGVGYSLDMSDARDRERQPGMSGPVPLAIAATASHS